MYITLFIWILVVYSSNVYGQRVYATTQQTGNTAFASVSNTSRAVDANYTNYSTLNISVGLIGLLYAQQNLQFTGALRPRPTAPIIIKFGSGGTLLGLVNQITIQRTNGGINGTFGTAYTSTTLAELINTNGGSNATEVSIPVPGSNEACDGLRFRLSTTLGIAVSARLYYAFFIAPPIFENTSIAICDGEIGFIEINNFQSNYTYKLYDSLTGGNLIASSSSQLISFNAANLTSGNYYVEAVETASNFSSSRTLIQITKYPKPGNPAIGININQN